MMARYVRGTRNRPRAVVLSRPSRPYSPPLSTRDAKMSLEEQVARAERIFSTKSAAEEEKDRVRAERIAFALSGLSRVASMNITPDFSPAAPDKRQVREGNLRAGCTSTNKVLRYEPKEAREEYEILPENHRQMTDLKKYTERALQLGDERKGTPQRPTPSQCPWRQYLLRRLVGLRVSHRSRPRLPGAPVVSFTKWAPKVGTMKCK
jgi:hypothetical protein